MSLSLDKYTADYVIARFRDLQEDFFGRNDRMDEMEDLYRLDVWETSADEDELRVASPRAHFTVERYRQLLLTEPPTIHVPEGIGSAAGQQVADRIEKYLYGAWNQMQMLDVLSEAEWHANCLGVGVVRVTYDERTPYGEFPLVAQALDPRNCYWFESGRRPNDVTSFIHALRRSRRKIIEEWGEVFDDRPVDAEQEQAWLNELVDYYDYWTTELVQEELDKEPEEEEGVNVMRTLLRRAQERMFPEEVEEEEPEKVWRRKVINCVVAENNVVKEAVVMEGYDRIPFVIWSGYKTGMQERKNRYLSPLYPLVGGDSGELGLIGAENQLLALKLMLAMKYANAALITNDPELENLDARPGAVNSTHMSRGELILEWVQPPGTHPDVDELLAQTEALAEQSSLPKAMHGQYVGEMSGVALSLLVNPVLTQIANRQRERERAWSTINAIILDLTEYFAPDDGWYVFGEDETGVEFEVALAPLLIGGYRHNQVKLSASLPKDRQMLAQTIMLLAKEMLLSRRTAVEQVQQIFGMRGRTPTDEMQQVLVESLLYGNEQVQQALSMEALAKYDPRLAQMMMEQMQPPKQQPGPPGQGPGGAGAREPMGGPMMGVPPEGVPPEMAGGGGNAPPGPRRGMPNAQNVAPRR